MRLIPLALALGAGLTGCAGASPAVPPRAVVELAPAPVDWVDFRLAGPASPATLAVRLQLAPRLLAMTAAADLKSLTLALVARPIDVPGAGATGLVPQGSLFSYDTSAATGQAAFANVPASAEGEAYQVVVAGFAGPAGTGANITNATGSDAEHGRVRLAGIDGPFYLSTGAVRVAPVTYALSSTAALEVGLKLLD